eukprot:349262-Pelagomonas_calceolata.AAC.7
MGAQVELGAVRTLNTLILVQLGAADLLARVQGQKWAGVTVAGAGEWLNGAWHELLHMQLTMTCSCKAQHMP